MMTEMRTFLALAPPESIAMDIHAAYEPMRRAWEGVKWTDPRHYHVTLSFWGDREPDLVSQAAGPVGEVICSHAAFDIEFSGVSRFGPATAPKLLFLKLGEGRHQLADLLEKLKPVLMNFSLWEDRSYRPHLTLGRPRRRGVSGPDDGALLPPGMKSVNVGTFRAGEVRLYQSTLKPQGAEYSVLKTWPLKEGI